MPRKSTNPKPGTRKYGTKSNYSKADLETALEKIKSCSMSQRNASQLYKIPRSTLKYKLKQQHDRTIGRPTALTLEEENTFIRHIVTLADLGLPIGLQDVRILVQRYLNITKKNISFFKNNMPGWEWGKLFIQRHPEIKQRIAHNISRKRAQVDEAKINHFFDHISGELAGIPPENIFNFDETGFHVDPKKAKLLFRRQCRNPEIIRNSSKSCYTVMFCGSAAGEMIPPFLIFKGSQKWSDWLIGAPPGSRMAVTKSGWIDADIFDEWFQTHLLPLLLKKEGPKAIIGDNLSSHITMKTLQLCEENNIKFICLIPNSTHLLQPLDLAYFSSLKSNWRSVLSVWRNTQRGKIKNALPKNLFAQLLQRTLRYGEQTARKNIQEGFKACGIYPCNREIVLQKLPGYGRPIAELNQSVGEAFKEFLSEIRTADLGTIQKRKFQIPVTAGKSVSSEEVENYYKAREVKTNKSTATKKGRPLGSKNKKPAIIKIKKLDEPSSRVISDNSNGNSSVPLCSWSPQPGPSGLSQSNRKLKQNEHEKNDSDDSSIGEENEPPSHKIISTGCFKDSLPTFKESVTVEEYVVTDGTLQPNVEATELYVGGDCIVNCEGSLFPGKITKVTQNSESH